MQRTGEQGRMRGRDDLGVWKETLGQLNQSPPIRMQIRRALTQFNALAFGQRQHPISSRRENAVKVEDAEYHTAVQIGADALSAVEPQNPSEALQF